MSWDHEAPFAQTGLVLQPPLGGSPGEVELVAFVPGPAGTSSTRVYSDVTVDVDFVEPDRLCSLEADDVGASRSLEQLIGPTAFRAVRMSLLADSDRSQRITKPENSMITAPRRQRGSSEPDSSVQEFAFSLAARAVGDDPYEPALVRAVAYVEAAALLMGSTWSGVVDESGLEKQLVFAAQTLLNDIDGEQVLAGLDLGDYERLRVAVADVVRQPRWAGKPWAQQLKGRFPQRLFDLDQYRKVQREQRAMPLLGMASSMKSVVSEALSLTEEPTVEKLGPGRFVYRFTSAPNGSWLRLTDRSSQALVALVPIQRKGRTWEAHVVAPVNVLITSVIVDTSDSPVVGSPSSVDTMIEAIDLGRAAARLSAAHEPAAADRWRLCARLWTQLGDTSRARRATAYATGRERVTRPAFVHDPVRDLAE